MSRSAAKTRVVAIFGFDDEPAAIIKRRSPHGHAAAQLTLQSCLAKRPRARKTLSREHDPTSSTAVGQSTGRSSKSTARRVRVVGYPTIINSTGE
jgi:hypothetical protein